MKTFWLAAGGLALACGVAAQTKTANLNTIYVEVVAGRVAVSPAGFRLASGQNSVTWWLRTAGWRFEAGAVDFGAAAGYFSCSVLNEGQGYRCMRSERAPSGELPYALRVAGASGTSDSDPGIFIQNE